MDTIITLVYTGSDVNIQYLQNILEKAGINSIKKNNYESGLRAGFYGGDINQVQLFVPKAHESEAKKIVQATFPE
ncbi:DUF2007 domain-containing protein [uncultured Mesonia sp.]|uniref:putative signal transducing protein n=1 Tax=uncultured Mesonia sp. TaxID=399731 RepID=UPI00374FD853